MLQAWADWLDDVDAGRAKGWTGASRRSSDSCGYRRRQLSCIHPAAHGLANDAHGFAQFLPVDHPIDGLD